MQFTHFSVKEFLSLTTSARVVPHRARCRSNWVISTARDYVRSASKQYQGPPQASSPAPGQKDPELVGLPNSRQIVRSLKAHLDPPQHFSSLKTNVHYENPQARKSTSEDEGRENLQVSPCKFSLGRLYPVLTRFSQARKSWVRKKATIHPPHSFEATTKAIRP